MEKMKDFNRWKNNYETYKKMDEWRRNEITPTDVAIIGEAMKYIIDKVKDEKDQLLLLQEIVNFGVDTSLKITSKLQVLFALEITAIFAGVLEDENNKEVEAFCCMKADAGYAHAKLKMIKDVAKRSQEQSGPEQDM